MRLEEQLTKADGLGATAVVVGLWVAGIVVISTLGWAVSSLHTLAGWTDNATVTDKLEIIKGLLASIAAGGVVAALGWHYQMPIILVFVGVFLGGFSGDKYLKPIAEKFLERVFGKVAP
jgi:hypothetical protein